MPPKDRAWVLDQVMAVEAPEAVEMLQRSLRRRAVDRSRASRAGADD